MIRRGLLITLSIVVVFCVWFMCDPAFKAQHHAAVMPVSRSSIVINAQHIANARKGV